MRTCLIIIYNRQHKITSTDGHISQFSPEVRQSEKGRPVADQSSAKSKTQEQTLNINYTKHAHIRHCSEASSHHITHVLKCLNWLKIPEQSTFKVLSLTYNSLQNSQPTLNGPRSLMMSNLTLNDHQDALSKRVKRPILCLT